MKTSSCILFAPRASTLAALLSACVAAAQTTPTARPASGEVVGLSPFTVSEAKGTGYLYSTSTSGTRTTRATIEVTQSIHMVTNKMLQDIDEKNVEVPSGMIALGVTSRLPPHESAWPRECIAE